MAAGVLTGKVAIVTGAGSVGDGVGTGRAIGVRFATEGARVCLVDREPALAKKTLEWIERDGGEGFVVGADVTDEDSCRRIVEDTTNRWGGVDILVNNVGIGVASPRIEEVDAVWDRVLSTNLESALFMSRFAIPHMVSRGGGSIVNIASIAGLRAGGNIAYGPSKAALIALTNELAVLYGHSGVRVNAIAPGHIYTPMVEGNGLRDLRRRIAPLDIEGTAWDVAGAALFFSGPDARFVTGTCLPVDGGVSVIGALAAHRRIVD